MTTDWVFAIIVGFLIIILLILMWVPNKSRYRVPERPVWRVIAEPGHMPTRAHPTDAGMDLRAKANVHLAPGQRHLVGTGVKGAIPDGYVGFVTPRSGLAHKHGISIVNAPGTIDSSYRGEIKINLINLGDTAHVIRKGDRIGQMVIQPVSLMPAIEVQELDTTARGAGGHGSTGN